MMYVNNKLKTKFFFIPSVWEGLVLKGWSNNSIHLQLLLSLNISKVLLKKCNMLLFTPKGNVHFLNLYVFSA